jgi:hypothetical protein
VAEDASYNRSRFILVCLGVVLGLSAIAATGIYFLFRGFPVASPCTVSISFQNGPVNDQGLLEFLRRQARIVDSPSLHIKRTSFNTIVVQYFYIRYLFMNSPRYEWTEHLEELGYESPVVTPLDADMKPVPKNWK